MTSYFYQQDARLVVGNNIHVLTSSACLLSSSPFAPDTFSNGRLGGDFYTGRCPYVATSEYQCSRRFVVGVIKATLVRRAHSRSLPLLSCLVSLAPGYRATKASSVAPLGLFLHTASCAEGIRDEAVLQLGGLTGPTIQ